MADTCGAEEFHAGPCREPAVTTVQYGCVHEHVGTTRLCASHQRWVLMPYLWCCDDCMSAGCLNCPVTLRETPDPETPGTAPGCPIHSKEDHMPEIDPETAEVLRENGVDETTIQEVSSVVAETDAASGDELPATTAEAADVAGEPIAPSDLPY